MFGLDQYRKHRHFVKNICMYLPNCDICVEREIPSDLQHSCRLTPYGFPSAIASKMDLIRRTVSSISAGDQVTNAEA
jgi:hypothetical protein